MTEDCESDADRDGGRDEGSTRRRLLWLAGSAVAGSLAGCSGAPSGGTTAGPTDSTTPPTTTTRPATTTPTTARETSTDTTTDATTRTTTPETTAAPRTFLEQSPSSHVAPTDGFADVAWLIDGDPEVLKVTTLDNHGEGSLRWALNQPGPRVVVFEVGGVVDLEEEAIHVEEGKLLLAGQTAPSPGITVVRGGVGIVAGDCVVQHVRFRAGDAGNERGWQPDALGSATGTGNNVFDHVTATWGVDETLSVGYHTRDTTVTNCIVAEGLHHASHEKGAHSYGSLIGNGARGVTLAGNLWSHNTARNPRLKAGTRSVVVNNVMDHFERAVTLDDTSVSAIHGNAFHRPDGRRFLVHGGRATLSENYSASGAPIRGNVYKMALRPFWPDGLEVLPGEQVTAPVLSSVGARPADRTPHDRRVVEQVREGTGSFIDSQREVGGYPDLPTAERALAVPETGLLEWLGQHTRSVEVAAESPP